MTGEPDEADQHFPDEATPREVPEQAIPTSEFGLHDLTWSEDQWLELLQTIVESGVGSWKDITALVLGHLNPSQVGTSLASSEGFKRRYGKGNTMKIVMGWVYQQAGRCADCGSRLELQADHIQGRESFPDPLDADFIENMTLRCRRCNVIRRPSHEPRGADEPDRRSCAYVDSSGNPPPHPGGFHQNVPLVWHDHERHTDARGMGDGALACQGRASGLRHRKRRGVVV